MASNPGRLENRLTRSTGPPARIRLPRPINASVIHQIDRANKMPLSTIREKYRDAIIKMRIAPELDANRRELEVVYGLRRELG